MKTKFKHEKGITLIALIITIIILVILAVVSINAVTNMGIVRQAVNGAQDYTSKAKEENTVMKSTGNLIENTEGNIKDILREKNILQFTFKNVTYDYEEGMTWGDYITSEYNTAGFAISERGYPDKVILNVYYPFNNKLQSATDVIQAINYEQYVCCFDPGTKILMADNTTKNIEDVKSGDKIISLNEDTGEYMVQTVRNSIIRHNSDDLVYVHLSNGTKLGMRAYHPLLTTEGWKSLRPEQAQTTMEVGYEVELLEAGDTLVGYEENLTIVAIEQRPEIENYDTYNLSIEGEYHNYIADGVVVHNLDCPEPKIKY